MQPALYAAENFVSLVWSVQARGVTELIPTVKMKTKHPAEGSFIC